MTWQTQKVARFSSKAADACADYLMMMHELELANQALSRLNTWQMRVENGELMHDPVEEAMYFEFALTHYFKCFQPGRHALKEDVFADLPETQRVGAKRLHSYFKTAYTRAAQRPANMPDMVHVGLSLHDDKKEVNDIFWLMSQPQKRPNDMVKSFGMLVFSLKKLVHELLDESRQKMLKEAGKVPVVDHYKHAVSGQDFARMVQGGEETTAPVKKGVKTDLSTRKTKKAPAKKVAAKKPAAKKTAEKKAPAKKSAAKK